MAFITQAQRTKLIELYVGYFNRAPEQAGLSYWANDLLTRLGQGKTEAQAFKEIADEFYKAGEQFGIFSAADPVDVFITKIYQNVLGRNQVDQAGMDYWKGKLNSGEVSRGQFVNQLIQEAKAYVAAAPANDPYKWVGTYLENRVAVADWFANNSANLTGQAAIQQGTAIIANSVTPTSAQNGQTAQQAVAAAQQASQSIAGQPFMLTTGVDSIVGTSGNDTINAVIDATNTPAASTFTALDSIDGGAGTDTLKISAITDFAVPSGATVTNVENVQIAAAAKVGTFGADGTGALDLSTLFAGVQDLTISSASQIDIKAPTSANVTITGSSGGVEVVGGANQTVNMKAAGAAVRLEGGKDVTVNLTGIAGSSDTVTVGTSAAPSGNVSVTMTGAAYTASTSNTTLSDINVTGGKSITVTQKATSDASAAASDTSNATITQGNVAITANADTKTVTVKQDASVTAANATNTTGGVTETATVKFGALKNGDALEVAGLKFTASADLTAAEVAAVFANLIKGAAYPAPANISAGDTQSGGLAGKGTYTLIASGWTSSAVSGDTVVFTSTTANSNVTDLGYTLTNTSGNSVAPVVTTTDGATHSATPTGGKMGIATGTVSITGSAALETVTIDGYKNSSAISGTLTALSTLNLANSDASAALTVADTADTLALNLEKVNGSITFTAAPLTLNVKSTGNNTATLTAAATTALNVSGTGVLTAGTSSLGNVKNIVVTESAGINLSASATLTALETVNTTASTGSTTNHHRWLADRLCRWRGQGFGDLEQHFGDQVHQPGRR